LIARDSGDGSICNLADDQVKFSSSAMMMKYLRRRSRMHIDADRHGPRGAFRPVRLLRPGRRRTGKGGEKGEEDETGAAGGHEIRSTVGGRTTRPVCPILSATVNRRGSAVAGGWSNSRKSAKRFSVRNCVEATI